MESKNGYFWIPFPQPNQIVFNAETCIDYEYAEQNIYEKPYMDFLNELKKMVMKI